MTALTTRQAGLELGIGKSRVLQLIKAGRLPATRIGLQYLIRRQDLAKVRDRRNGRPPSAAPRDG